jgi:hypothetical protein
MFKMFKPFNRFPGTAVQNVQDVQPLRSVQIVDNRVGSSRSIRVKRFSGFNSCRRSILQSSGLPSVLSRQRCRIEGGALCATQDERKTLTAALAQC